MNKLLIALLVSVGISNVALAEGDAAAGQAKAAVCFGCHGADGNSMAPTFPKLAGQSASYIVKQLQDIKGNVRNSPMMVGFAAGLSDQDMQDLGAFFASHEVKSGTTDPAKAELGEKIYTAGLADKGVAACVACHGPAGEGNPMANFPALKGQHAAYTESQLKAFASGARANDPNGMMRDVAKKLSDAEMAAVASYVEGL